VQPEFQLTLASPTSNQIPNVPVFTYLDDQVSSLVRQWRVRAVRQR
jgi:hypothetical protein